MRPNPKQLLPLGRNVAAGSPQTDTASPTVFILFSPNLFLNLCHHPLRAGNGLVTLSSGHPVPKSSYKFNALWCNLLLSRRTCFPLLASTRRARLFDTRSTHNTLRPYVVQSEVQRQSSHKFLFFLHSPMDRRLILPLSNLSIHF